MDTMQVRDLIAMLEKIEDKDSQIDIECHSREGIKLGNSLIIIRVRKTSVRHYSIVTEPI